MSDSLPPSMLHSMSTWPPNHFWSWTILIIGIVYLMYTLRVVSTEQKTFHQDGKWIQWLNFSLFIPSWWSLKNPLEDTREQLHFYRADTHYDWSFSAKFFLDLTPLEAKEKFLGDKQIVIDEDAVITSEKTYLLQNDNFLNKVQNFLRIETTATSKEEDRIYLDAIWIKMSDGLLLEFISKSSVLNGGIEGPYVEEVVKGIKFRD